MRNMKLLFATCLAVGIAIAPGALAQRAEPQTPAPKQQTTSGMQMSTTTVMKDIEQTFGFVPQFFRAIPEALLPTFWMGMKTFEMNPNTKLDAKTKELIGLAVASQIPCDYCIYFHTQAAQQNGATEQEIREAIGMASVTRMGSTLLNGAQLDKAQFRKDVDRAMKREGRSTQARQRTPATRTP